MGTEESGGVREGGTGGGGISRESVYADIFVLATITVHLQVGDDGDAPK